MWLRRSGFWKAIAVSLVLDLMFLMLFWAPWLTPTLTADLAGRAFRAAFNPPDEGCGLVCLGCAVRDVRWAPFGRSVRIDYTCGLQDAGALSASRSATVFVTFWGSVRDVPLP